MNILKNNPFKMSNTDEQYSIDELEPSVIKDILSTCTKKESRLLEIMSVLVLLIERNQIDENDEDDVITLFGKHPLKSVESLFDNNTIILPTKLGIAKKRIRKLEKELNILEREVDVLQEESPKKEVLSKLTKKVSFHEAEDVYFADPKLISHSYRSMVLKPSPLGEDENRILKVQTYEELKNQFDLMNNIEESSVYPNRHPKLVELDKSIISLLNKLNGADIRLDPVVDRNGDINSKILYLGENKVYGLELDYIEGETLSTIIEESVRQGNLLKYLFHEMIVFATNLAEIYERTGLMTYDISEDNIIIDGELELHCIDVSTFSKQENFNPYRAMISGVFQDFFSKYNEHKLRTIGIDEKFKAKYNDLSKKLPLRNKNEAKSKSDFYTIIDLLNTIVE